MSIHRSLVHLSRVSASPIHISSRAFSTSRIGLAKSAVGEKISEVAKSEGGPSKGSQAAKLQSEATKAIDSQQQGDSSKSSNGIPTSNASNQDGNSATTPARTRNGKQELEIELPNIKSQLESAPETITKPQADHIQSLESRAQGGGRPPKGGLAAQAMSAATKNEDGATDTNIANSSNPNANPNSETENSNAAQTRQTSDPAQSQADRKANYAQAAEEIGRKLENEPERLSKQDANHMHSREQRAFGSTSKGGLAAEVARAVQGKGQGN